MTKIKRSGMEIAASLVHLIEERVLPGTGLSARTFWDGMAAIFARFAPENAALLAKRTHLQQQIDAWHEAHRGESVDQAIYADFLRRIGYLVDEPAVFTISTHGVDPEIARLAGPQLVVPILNARFLLNAANARWGSLYDALYGTDSLGAAPVAGEYDRTRGEHVIAWAKDFLDRAVPLAKGKWSTWRGGRPSSKIPPNWSPGPKNACSFVTMACISRS